MYLIRASYCMFYITINFDYGSAQNNTKSVHFAYEGRKSVKRACGPRVVVRLPLYPTF